MACAYVQFFCVIIIATSWPDATSINHNNNNNNNNINIVLLSKNSSNWFFPENLHLVPPMTLLLSTIVAVAVANHHFRCTHHVSPLPLLHLLITIWLILILKKNSNLIFTDRNYSHCCWDFSSYYNTPSISVNATLEVVAVVSLDPSTYNLSTDLRTSSAPINSYAWCH